MSWWLILGLVVLAALVVWSVGVWYYAKKLETPNYTVTNQADGYEVRQYDPILVIQTTVQGDATGGMNKGFMVLAGYIFGGNQSRQSVAMTTPVLDQPLNQNIAMTTPVLDQSQNNERVVTFTVPEKWTKEALPIPNDDRVNIVEWPAETKAVKRFMTLSTFGQSARDKASTQLLEVLERDGVAHEGDVTFAFYNPPWTPFFLRRNEVMVTIKK